MAYVLLRQEGQRLENLLGELAEERQRHAVELGVLVLVWVVVEGEWVTLSKESGLEFSVDAYSTHTYTHKCIHHI